MVFILIGIIKPEIGFLGHMVTLSEVFQAGPDVFLTEHLHHFTFLAAMCDASSFFHKFRVFSLHFEK